MEAPRASALDRFLRLFTDVRAGEGVNTVLLSLNIFLILTAYYILKPVREALILGEGSAEMKSYISAGQVILLGIVVPLYARLAARVPRRRLLNIVTAFFVACLVVFYFLAQAGISLGAVFFLWVGIFNLMVPSMFWSFTNDIYTKDEGERLIPIVQFGASLGAVLGATIAALLIAPLGVYQLMLIAGVILVLEVQITKYLDKKERQRTEAGLPEAETTAMMPAATVQVRDEESKTLVVTKDAKEEKPKRSSAFRLVFQTRYLLLIALLMLFNNWVNTTGEYILGSVVEDAAEAAVASGEAGGLTVAEYIGQFYSKFYGVVNILGLVLQLFVVSRIIKYFGVQVGILVLPIISFSAYNVLAFIPILAVVRWAKTLENSTDYSLNVTSYNMLFLPCTREQKYSAKQAIDSFFVRVGDVASALLVFMGTTYFALSAGGFAKFNIVLVIIWLILAVLIGRQYKRLRATGQPPR
jgi:AAA family ATP:ADP antiporter